jgi:hypothetical protein
MSEEYADDGGARPTVGSAAEEAARLVEALRRWVDDRGVSVPGNGDEASDCRLCPICQAIAALRKSQPEVVEHLGQAADSLLAAVRAAISEHEAHWSRPAQPDVEHIDID